ncbi:MAG: hypothetical protein SF053_11370 [Bacteroidia bacterium]|nr:hypothetical protein [Bacteroidia bacterium]
MRTCLLLLLGMALSIHPHPASAKSPYPPVYLHEQAPPPRPTRLQVLPLALTVIGLLFAGPILLDRARPVTRQKPAGLSGK